MISKLFSISSMYPGYLESFYSRFDSTGMTYAENYSALLNDTTEFTGSYTKTFNKLGIDAQCVIANDRILQSKWKSENNIKTDDDRNLLFEQVKKFQPDVLWIDNLTFTDNDWLVRARNDIKSIKLIIAYHCSPFNHKIAGRLKDVDFLITCTPGLRQEMERNGVRTYLVYHGFDKSLLARVMNENRFVPNNFIFSGSILTGAGFHGERMNLIEKLLKADLDLKLFVKLEKVSKIRSKQMLYCLNEVLKKLNLEGLGKKIPLLQYGKEPINNYSGLLIKNTLEPVYGIDMFKLFHSSGIVLNMHGGIAGSYAGNMRIFEVTGLGSCLLTDNKKNIGDLFDVSKEIVTYDSAEDCISKAKWLLQNEAERKKIAEAGQKRTLCDHTVENRCKLILDIIDEELKAGK